MIAEDLSRARRATRVDRLAASWILQGALDALARHKELS
jgi:putative Holliday junction resolvase